MKVFNVRQHQQVLGTFVRIEAKTHLALGVGWCWISWSRVSRVRRLGVPLGSHNSDQCSEDEDLSKSGDNFFPALQLDQQMLSLTLCLTFMLLVLKFE